MKRMPVYFRKRLSVTALLIAVTLTGCGTLPDQDIEEVALMEPKAVNNDINAEPVVRRNLYNATLYPTTVSPYIEEYSFQTDQQFGSYGPLLGEQVRKGDVLMTASGTTLSDQIEVLEEKLQDMAEEHKEYCEEAGENLQELRKEVDRLQEILDNLDSYEPEATVSGGDASSSENVPVNPEYTSWLTQRQSWQAEYNLAEYYVTTSQYELDKHQELYELDYQYYHEQLQELLAKRSDETIRSQMDGVVVALGDYVYDNNVPKDQPVIAVADLTKKYIRCSYIRERFLTGADQLYAFINGKRYDVTLYDNNQKYLNQTTFTLLDGNDEVEVGSYAVLVLVSDYREQVLTVPTGSIFREDSKDFVYVLENGQSVTREVKKGISDSFYTEILSGLSEGESVLISETFPAGSSHAVLEKGNVGNARHLGGQIVYPLKTVVKSTIENGDVYFEKYAAKKNAYVEKGSLLALINVKPDLIALNRREVSLARQKARLEDLIAMNRQEDEKTIQLTRESIQEEEEELAKIKADYAATEIHAPASGYIVYLRSRTSGEIISQKDPVIAHIADDTTAYLSISDSNGISAGYGTLLNIICEDEDGNEFTVEGKVLTADNFLLSDSLQGNAMVLMPLEVRQSMSYSAKKPVPVEFTGEQMENVILVPRDAVTCVGSNTYVNIQNEDGSLTAVSFLSGGSDRDYYWAIDGLTEGMVVCWE